MNEAQEKARELRAKRTGKGWTLRRLGMAALMDMRTVQTYESGRHSGRPNAWKRLFAALEDEDIDETFPMTDRGQEVLGMITGEGCWTSADLRDVSGMKLAKCEDWMINLAERGYIRDTGRKIGQSTVYEPVPRGDDNE